MSTCTYTCIYLSIYIYICNSLAPITSLLPAGLRSTGKNFLRCLESFIPWKHFWPSTGLLFCKPLCPQLERQGLSNLLTCAGVRGWRAHDREQKSATACEISSWELKRLRTKNTSYTAAPMQRSSVTVSCFASRMLGRLLLACLPCLLHLCSYYLARPTNRRACQRLEKHRCRQHGCKYLTEAVTKHEGSVFDIMPAPAKTENVTTYKKGVISYELSLCPT